MLKQTFEEKLKKVKPEKNGMPEVKSKEYFPSVHFDSKTLPEIKDWEVGEEYVVVMKLKQTSYSEHENDKENTADASFDIVEIGVLDKEDNNETDDEEDLKISKAKLMNKYGKHS